MIQLKFYIKFKYLDGMNLIAFEKKNIYIYINATKYLNSIAEVTLGGHLVKNTLSCLM